MKCLKEGEKKKDDEDWEEKGGLNCRRCGKERTGRSFAGGKMPWTTFELQPYSVSRNISVATVV